MQIYKGIITLDYNPVTDVLVSEMPNPKQFGLSEVSFCLGLIVENVRNYDIKNLLLDSSKSTVDLEDEAYKAISIQFAKDLFSTRLQRIARVSTTDASREEKAAKLTTELKQELKLPMQFKNFTSQAEAMQWLRASA
jgi:hypothetical protein